MAVLPVSTKKLMEIFFFCKRPGIKENGFIGGGVGLKFRCNWSGVAADKYLIFFDIRVEVVGG